METQMEPQQVSKKRFYKRWWFWAGLVVLFFIIIGISGSNSSSGVSVPAPAETGSTVAGSEQTTTSASASAAPQVLLNLSGSGSKTTAKFTAASDWDLNWSYDCSNFGTQGNFQVFIYSGNGSLSYNNSPVNQLGTSGADVEHYHSGGTYYLTVNSECAWKIQVQG